MSIKLQVPKPTDLKPRITVIGVGGAGGNAVNNMIASGLPGVDFIVANTDAQALVASKAPSRIQLGINLTEGLGAGSKPEVGEAAAIEAEAELKSRITGSHMLFIAAGMGGGTGTGAAAVIGKVARELGILTIAVVTKPFQFEGSRRMRIAEAGVVELKKYVDTLIVIPNQNLFRIANEKTTFAEAFILADQVLYSGIACIVDLIVKDGLINLDLADVRTVLTGMGPAVMGTGEGSGERRAAMAAEEAITNQLLDNMSLKGAKGLLLSIIGGPNLTLFDVDEAASRVRQEIDPEANVIVGAAFDEALGDRVRVSIVASGMPESVHGAMPPSISRPQRTAPATQHSHPAASMEHGAAPAMLSPLGPGSPAPKATPPPLPGQHAKQNARPASALGSTDQAFDSWLGPDQVHVAERGSHVMAEQVHGGRPPVARTSGESVYTQPESGFVPQQPADVRRAPPRVPEVDDFPPIGQKEYWAKKATSADAATSVETSDPAPVITPREERKGSLFQRLADAARGRTRSPARAASDESRELLPEFFDERRRRG